MSLEGMATIMQKVKYVLQKNYRQHLLEAFRHRGDFFDHTAYFKNGLKKEEAWHTKDFRTVSVSHRYPAPEFYINLGRQPFDEWFHHARNNATEKQYADILARYGNYARG